MIACLLTAASSHAATAASTQVGPPPTLTVANAQAASPPTLSAKSAVLIDASTGQELYALNPGNEVAIASATKLMTALVTLEHARLRAVFADPDYHPAAVDSQLGLVPGQRMSVHDLLIAMLLPSADDAAEDLAYNVGNGSVSRFIAMMNAEARRLGLTGTHYTTPIGLDTPGNYSNARDLIALARYELARYPFLRRVVASPSALLRIGDQPREVTNRNDLVGSVRGVNGVKTGHTLDAGYVLVASATRHGMTLLSAVLGTDSTGSRDSSTLALLNYGFTNFRLREPVTGGTVLAQPSVRDRSGVHADVIAASSFSQVFPRSTPVTVQAQVPRQLAGPLAQHAVVGTAIVFAGGQPVARVPLVLARPLPAVGTLTRLSHFIFRPLPLVLITLCLCAAIAMIMLLRARTRSRAATRPA